MICILQKKPPCQGFYSLYDGFALTLLLHYFVCVILLLNMFKVVTFKTLYILFGSLMY